eukprot:UN32416
MRHKRDLSRPIDLGNLTKSRTCRIRRESTSYSDGLRVPRSDSVSSSGSNQSACSSLSGDIDWDQNVNDYYKSESDTDSPKQPFQVKIELSSKVTRGRQHVFNKLDIKRQKTLHQYDFSAALKSIGIKLTPTER